MLHTLHRGVISILLGVACTVAARGEGIFDYVPADALGVVVVRDLAATDAKVRQLEEVFAGLSDVPLPAPLALFKAATGFGDGLDEDGDALLAMLIGDDERGDPKPMLLIPVTDYARFAAAIGADASGEVARVRIAQQDVLAARRGDYALLMNVEHRPTMEAMLATPTTDASPAFDELADWLDRVDVAGIVLPKYVEIFVKYGPESNEDVRAAATQELAQLGGGAALVGLNAGLAINARLIEVMRTDVQAVAVGAAVDKAGNVRLSNRVALKPDGPLAALESASRPEGSPLAGVPDQPFVLGGGGPLPKGWAEAIARVARTVTHDLREGYGFDGFEDLQWEQVEESWRLSLQERAGGFVMLVGDKGAPLIGNVYNHVHVDDSAAYLNALRRSTEMWNQLTLQSSSDLKLIYELVDVEVDGHKGLLVTADVAGAAGDEEYPLMKVMWETALGKGGQYRHYYLPLDDTRVLAVIGDEAQARQGVAWATANERGLADSLHVKSTAKLLDPAAAWMFYVSPQGCVAWYERLYGLLTAQFGAPAIKLPVYAAGPPIGVGITLDHRALQVDAVAPVQTLRDLAAFAREAKKLEP
jgi:hypothetical protein